MGEKPSFVTPETMREAAETETAVISSEAPENVPEETALMETEEADAPAYKVYTVGEGETLYGICFKVYQNVNKLDEICRINELRDQNSIYAWPEASYAVKILVRNLRKCCILNRYIKHSGVTKWAATVQ